MKTTNTKITTVQICDLKPFANNPRTHTKKQISQIARSLEQFGWTNPVLIDEGGMILAGHALSLLPYMTISASISETLSWSWTLSGVESAIPACRQCRFVYDFGIFGHNSE